MPDDQEDTPKRRVQYRFTVVIDDEVDEATELYIMNGLARDIEFFCERACVPLKFVKQEAGL